jgi:hypothetical protein
MEINMSFKKHLVRFSTLMALSSSAVLAGPYFANKPWWAYSTLDFSASSSVAGHLSWDTWTPPAGTAGTKYVNLALSKKISGGGQCYAINIEDQGASEVADLRYWTQDNRSIDDDGPAGDRRPVARFWITGDFILKISAYSTSYNNVDFGIYNYIYENVTTAAACDDGVSPFYNQVTDTILRANTTAN